jgi:hypothetical protein
VIADIASGHVDAADVLFLIAAIIFAVAALLPLRTRPVALEAMLVPAGLCLVAVAWLLL